MSETDNKAVFLAAFPSIQSAIKVTGDKCGMRVQLDIPETELAEGIKLLMWRQQVLQVTIEPKPRQDFGVAEQENDTGTVSRTKAKKRVGAGDSGV